MEPLARNDWLTLAVSVLIAVAAVDVFVRSSGPARKAGRPALAAALAFAGVLALGAVDRLAGWGADLAMLLLYDTVVTAVAIVLLLDLLFGRWVDATVADLVIGLGGEASASLQTQLRRAMGDPSATGRLLGSGRSVDTSTTSAPPVRAPGRPADPGRAPTSRTTAFRSRRSCTIQRWPGIRSC